MRERVIHPDIARFCIIRQDYVAITQGNRCAAVMLSIFEGYTNWLSRQGLMPWVDLSGEEISAAMCGLYSRKAIMAAGVLLDRLGLVRRKQKSSCNRTYQYLLLTEEVQKRIELATFWDASLKLAIRCFQTGGNWYRWGIKWLKALWGAIDLKRTMQEVLDRDASDRTEQCIEQDRTTYKDVPNISFSTPTNTEAPASACRKAFGRLPPEKLHAPGGDLRAAIAAGGGAEEESAEKVKAAIANSPFMQEDICTDPPKQPESSSQDKSSAAASESNNNQITIFHRLRDLGVVATRKVRILIKETSPDQLERNLLALEEEAAAKGLKKPVAAFMSCVEDNWQPRNDRETWWQRATEALGKERRDRLIAHVTELWGRIVVCFTNGHQIPLDEALGMSWDALAQLGGEA